MDMTPSSRSKESVAEHDFGADAAIPSRSGPTTGPPPGKVLDKVIGACVNGLIYLARAPTRLRRVFIRHWQSFKRSSKPVRGLLIWLVCCFIFAVPLCLFVFRVLIQGHPKIGAIIFDATLANLLISIFAQMSATFMDSMLKEYLSVVRSKLGAPGHGPRVATFIGIGPASQWTSTAKLVLACRILHLLLVLRLALPGLAIAIGSAMKIDANFETHFIASGVEVPVYAGLVPMDDRLVRTINVTDLCQFIGSWTANLQGSSRYAMRTSLDGCDDGCRPLLWPGGMETVRQARSTANYSAFYNGHFDHDPAVQVDNAPGIITAFTSLPRDFSFLDAECVYGGSLSNDSLKVCARQVGQGVAAGWAACPQRLKDANQCDVDSSWKQAPMKWTVKIDAYRQYTNTIYDRRNLSIIHSQPVSEPERIPLHARQYMDIFEKAFVPSPNATSIDNATVATLAFNLGWMHRTFTEVFPDNTGTIVTSLENVLAVPLQWSVTAHQLANYSLAARSPSSNFFALPDNMLTVARGGKSVQRLAIQPWTGCTFIATHVAILLFVLANIIWIMQASPIREVAHSLPELDMLAMAPKITCYKRSKEPDVQGYEQELLLNELADEIKDVSSCKAAKELRDWRVKVSDSSP